MNELKRRIARGDYEIEAAAVAEEIFKKLRMMHHARRVLDVEPAPGPRQRPRLRSGRFRLPAAAPRSRGRDLAC